MITAQDIKAKDFFKALKYGKSHFLNVDNHEEVFINLQDEYFLLRDSGVEKQDLNNRKQIALLSHKYSVLGLIREVYQGLPLDKPRRDKVEKSLNDIGFKLKNDDSKPLTDQAEAIEKQFQSFEGQIVNKIKIAELNLMQKGKKQPDYNYGGTIVAFEHIIERSIDENISLAKYIAYEKEANAKLKRLNEQKNKQ